MGRMSGFGRIGGWKTSPCRIDFHLYIDFVASVMSPALLNVSFKRGLQGRKLALKNARLKHLFFDYNFAIFVWRAVHITFGVAALTSINHMYSDWLHGLNTRAKSLIMVGVAMLCWTLWLSRNDIVFEKCSSKTYIHVFYRGTHWCRFWAQLQRRDEDKDVLRNAYQILETTVMQIFTFSEWCFCYRIASS
jgi:hypothetical protein